VIGHATLLMRERAVMATIQMGGSVGFFGGDMKTLTNDINGTWTLCRGPRTLSRAITNARNAMIALQPDFLLGVPRVFEKVDAGVMSALKVVDDDVMTTCVDAPCVQGIKLKLMLYTIAQCDKALHKGKKRPW
jgi:hypothetical protein